MDGNWKLRCEDPDIQNQTMYSHCLKLPRAEDIACDNCCDFYCLKSIYLLNIFIFLTRRNFRAQKNAPHFFFVFVPLAAHGKYFLIFFCIFFHIPDMDRDFVIQFRYFIVALERTKKIAALPQNKMLVAISVWLGSHAHILGFFQEWTVIPALKPLLPEPVEQSRSQGWEHDGPWRETSFALDHIAAVQARKQVTESLQKNDINKPARIFLKVTKKIWALAAPTNKQNL